MEAAARASKSAHSANQNGSLALEVKEQLRDLKQDIYLAMMALKAAQEKMHFLDKTINGGEFSAA